MDKERQLYILTFHYITSIHKDVTERLVQINPTLADRARVVLDLNKSERHLRGGLATKEKYLHKSKYGQVF
ncbi:sporulation transcriptional regulator SpoIIID [Anaerocolumna sp.]|uniref:sporulation transcriptional regulator SpoIIID n=1 Tax=Anaerocolumna sp. TaxID=2041569 RepID=UPI0028AF345A|nr:sporulation transcriptional regulator SpoIIID [Anaerocolumna sp.]